MKGGTMLVIFVLQWLFKGKEIPRKKKGPLPSLASWNEREERKRKEEEGDVFDVCIIGSGPSGSTCAFYLARAGKRVLLLEKDKLPREKMCCSTINTRAQTRLRKMGVLQEILSEMDTTKWARNGGLVSPSGDSFIGEFISSTVLTLQCNVLDEKIAIAASKEGAVFKDNSFVESVDFNEESSIWTIVVPQSLHHPFLTYKSRALVVADGAESAFYNHLGVPYSPPDMLAAFTSTEQHTHALKADHVRFYPKELLPGHLVMTSAPEGVLNISLFVPCDKKIEDRVEYMNKVFDDMRKNDAMISKALGPNVKLKPLKVTTVRSKLIPRSYGQHFLIIGEAAGHVDPLTQDGIHCGMDAGKIAAEVLIDALNEGDLSEARLEMFDKIWKQEYSREFYFSEKIARLFQKHPIVLDATVAVIRRRGVSFVTSWALVTTGVKSKLWLARPDVGWMIALEAVSLWLDKLVSFGK